jgi:RNA methyltransferase, RsmE family
LTRFFSSQISPGEEFFTILNDDAQHIIKSLRMKPGEKLILCNNITGYDHLCTITKTTKLTVDVRVEKQIKCFTEPPLKITLFQALPKFDKLDFIIQKAVELGVFSVVPFISDRCISRPDKQSAEKKLPRFNKIAYDAACQSSRSIIPAVMPIITFDEVLNKLPGFDLTVMCYEEFGAPLSKLDFSVPNLNAALIIGPEGGFLPDEAKNAEAHGAALCTLGPRILRTETASLCALSAIMFAAGALDNS